MKYLTLILVLAAVAFASATPSRIDFANLAVRDVTGKYDGLLAANGTCGDPDFVQCTNSTICCPTGAACITGGCDLQCTTEDITCGSGCCFSDQICTSDFHCASKPDDGNDTNDDDSNDPNDGDDNGTGNSTDTGVNGDNLTSGANSNQMQLSTVITTILLTYLFVYM